MLASASPRRRELMALLGLPFEVLPSRYEEPTASQEPIFMAEFVTTLALHKAQEVAARVDGDSWVIGADTEVALDLGEKGMPLGKPIDAEDARRMLRLLSGRAHVVYTGVALLRAPGGGEPITAAERTLVRFREMTEAMIDDYVATGEPLDKAGAYGAQGYAAPFIAGFEGDFFNVVGLPLCLVGRLLEQAGIPWWHYRLHMPPLIG
ncbi:MAG TPA: Maf family protein [Chthonomonadaceae bacterium]|nr:Maf family protein [Chthonomonadaceae bacterium]